MVLESWDKVIDFMTEKVKRLGRASGSGFYDYPQGGKKYLCLNEKIFSNFQKYITPRRND